MDEKNLPYRVYLVNSTEYAGRKIFVKENVIWIIEPYRYNYSRRKYEKMNIFRLGIPLIRVSEIEQLEKIGEKKK